MIRAIQRWLCRRFGHPEDDRYELSFCTSRHEGAPCGPGETVLVVCGRCGEKLLDRLGEVL